MKCSEKCSSWDRPSSLWPCVDCLDGNRYTPRVSNADIIRTLANTELHDILCESGWILAQAQKAGLSLQEWLDSDEGQECFEDCKKID